MVLVCSKKINCPIRFNIVTTSTISDANEFVFTKLIIRLHYTSYCKLFDRCRSRRRSDLRAILAVAISNVETYRHYDE